MAWTQIYILRSEKFVILLILICIYVCIICNEWNLWVRISLRARCATLCNKVCYCAGRWFSPGTPVSSTNKTDRHDVTENIVESGVNHQKNLNPNTFIYYYCIFWWSIHIVDQNPKYTHKSVLNLIVLNTNIIIEECFLSMKLLHRLAEITSARCT